MVLNKQERFFGPFFIQRYFGFGRITFGRLVLRDIFQNGKPQAGQKSPCPDFVSGIFVEIAVENIRYTVIYGKLFEIWFDGGVLPVSEGGPDVAALLKKLQPDAVTFQGPVGTKSLIRWVGNERGVAPEECSSLYDNR